MDETWRQFDAYQAKVEEQRAEIRKRIIGLDGLVDALFVCFYAHSERKLGPHLLVEGKVGKGKTATLDTFARTIAGAKFSRIQFTPDLRPLDLIRIVEQREDRSLEFHSGPLFANLVLADEINRAHEKTRAALLEAMGERQITIGDQTYTLEEPFFVMATENPIDVEGTFVLGAAQLDRFMMEVYTEPLSEDQEIIIAETHGQVAPEVRAVLTKAEVLEIRDFIRRTIAVTPEVRRDIVRLVRALRPEAGLVAPEEFYLLPEGERGYLFLERGAKVRAFLKGRDHVTFADVAALAFPVLNHRIGFQYAHKNSGKLSQTQELISRAIEKVVEDGARGL
ncbi:MAG TPA: AAA family ATPase [Anaerolineae bacterium]|nr:AAA family ATPase [Anaerolineae bacterium]HPL27702.1 AAA family ATPase [Anaerolineae bacterium]